MEEFKRELALGLLFKGYLHNLRGPVQALLMQLELLQTKLATLEVPEDLKTLLEDFYEKTRRHINRLVDLLSAAESEVQNDSPGPWKLKELLEREKAFWEGNLEFKHKVKKRLVCEDENVKVEVPLNVLRAALLSVFYSLVPKLVEEEGELSIFVEKSQEGPVVRFLTKPAVKAEEEFVKMAERVLSPYAVVKTEPEGLTISFKK